MSLRTARRRPRRRPPPRLGGPDAQHPKGAGVSAGGRVPFLRRAVPLQQRARAQKKRLGTIPPHYTRAARRSPPCTRHPTPLVAGRRLAISPCHLVVSWTWPRGGLGLGVLGEGMATKAKGRPRMAASPAQIKSRRGSKGAFVERTHLAAEHSGRHEQPMILMRLVNNPYCTRSGT